MSSVDPRKRYGDPIIRGVGVEIGAGLCPIIHDMIEQLYFFDKRNPEEFEAYFNAPPPYDILSLDSIFKKFPNGVDFVNSHHVLEHTDDPIAALKIWISLLKEDGVLYLSIPSPNNPIEQKRLLTPLRHLLEDHFFERPIGSYESKEHIYSFVTATLRCGGEWTPWYAKDDFQHYAEYLLYDVERRDDHDLHWHTITLETLLSVIEIAFFLAGSGCERLISEEAEDSYYVAYRRTPSPQKPEALQQFHQEIAAVADRLSTL